MPAKDFGKVEVKISDVPAGNYRLNVYQIGYQINDVYDDYLKISSPKNLSRQQVKELNDCNDGKPIESLSIKIDGKRNFNKSLNLRENDVFMISLEKVK